MRIVNREQFLKLPPGVAYHKCTQRWAFSDLQFKRDTTSSGQDWWSVQSGWVEGQDTGESVDRLDAMADTGASYPLETSEYRDGTFEEDALFLVLEADDLAELERWIAEAKETLGKTVAETTS